MRDHRDYSEFPKIDPEFDDLPFDEKGFTYGERLDFTVEDCRLLAEKEAAAMQESCRDKDDPSTVDVCKAGKLLAAICTKKEMALCMSMMMQNQLSRYREYTMREEGLDVGRGGLPIELINLLKGGHDNAYDNRN